MQLGTIMPVAAVAGAVIVVLLYLYYVKGYFRNGDTITTVDMPQKLRRIKKMADSGKYDEAIILAYRTFEEMVGNKTRSNRASSETAREFIQRTLKILPLNAEKVETFIDIYHKARFSDHKLSRDSYESAIKIFTDIYPRIEGATPSIAATSAS
ncbi:DUF4129 domain-containing protein [Candidatus Thorarchaeota archaeon]|nr:MAG: DUF4129 domain-containing protein [Candidatus Thorarchaeota archaeon]